MFLPTELSSVGGGPAKGLEIGHVWQRLIASAKEVQTLRERGAMRVLRRRGVAVPRYKQHALGRCGSDRARAEPTTLYWQHPLHVAASLNQPLGEAPYHGVVGWESGSVVDAGIPGHDVSNVVVGTVGKPGMTDCSPISCATMSLRRRRGPSWPPPRDSDLYCEIDFDWGQ